MRLFWFFTIALGVGASALAQDDYFEVEDPEEFIEPIPEPYYEEPLDDFDLGAPPPPPPEPDDYEPRPGGSNRPSFRAPPANRPTSRPAVSSGTIEFRLMDPPKYYVGEKLPDLPKPKRKR